MQKCDEVFFKEIIGDGRDYRRMMRRWESNANSPYGHWTMMPRWPNASKSPPPLTPVHNNHSNNSNNNNKPHHRHEKQWCVPNSILVDWLVEVHLKFKLIPETLYVTVNLIDCYLVRREVSRPKLQLIGVTALLITSRYEEIYPPKLHDLVYICDSAYSEDEILKMEETVLRAVEYKITIPSSHAFLVRYLKAAPVDKRVVQLSWYIVLTELFKSVSGCRSINCKEMCRKICMESYIVKICTIPRGRYITCSMNYSHWKLFGLNGGSSCSE